MAKGQRNQRDRDEARRLENEYREALRSGHHRRRADDYTDGDTVSSYNRTKTVKVFLEQLFEKRGSTRETALSSIIEEFTVSLQHEFAEKNFGTLMFRCFNSIKKGSTKEICLALHVIGLLAITISNGDFSHELYEKSLCLLSQALKPGSESSKIQSIFDCLAIVTFFGARDADETERSMQILWQFIHPDDSNVAARKQSTAVVAAAISAWTFLLTTIDGWRLSYKYWQGAISYFLDQLEEGDESVRVASSEALAMIFEIGCLEKFSSTAKDSTEFSAHQKGKLPEDYSSFIQELKSKILKRVRSFSTRPCVEDSLEKDDGRLQNSNWNALKFLQQDGYCPEIFMDIGGHRLTVSTWSKLIQLNFLEHFLGDGFDKHMLENELLHDVFKFTPRRKDDSEHFISDSEEVVVRYFMPGTRYIDCIEESTNKEWKKKLIQLQTSALDKARMKLRNKQRMISQSTNFSHYIVDDGYEAE